MQEPPLTAAINVRAPGYLAAVARCACWHCGRDTPVVGIALTPAHETWIDDAPVSGAARAAGVWQAAAAGAWIFYVEYLPLGVRRRLQALSPLYRYAYNRATDGAYWLNLCAHCGSAQDDDHLHGEPGAGFMPTSAQAAARIELIAVNERFAAWAGGYSYDPPLFEAMRAARPGPP